MIGEPGRRWCAATPTLAATLVAGLMSLSKALPTWVSSGGPVRQALIEMRDSYLILTAAGPGAHLAVLTNQGADVGVVAYQMNMLVKKIGERLGSTWCGIAAAADNGE